MCRLSKRYAEPVLQGLPRLWLNCSAFPRLPCRSMEAMQSGERADALLEFGHLWQILVGL